MAWPDKDFKYGKWEKAVDNDIKMLRCPDCKCQVIRKDYESAIGEKGIRFCPYCGKDMWGRAGMTECTLHNLLTSCQYSQVFWIYRSNNYDQNLLLAKGTKKEMFQDDEVSFDLIDHINDVVEYWTIREDGAMFVRLRAQARVEDLYFEDYVKKWDRNPHSRPWLYSAEMDDFTHTIHGSSEYMHPYGDPLEVHFWDKRGEQDE